MPHKNFSAADKTFDAPWQARTFALCVALNARGVFTWREWSARLATNIKAHEKTAPVESNDAYYQIWQQTLEELVREKTG